MCVLATAGAAASGDALVAEILELDRSALALEQRLHHPEATGLSVYIGSEAPDLLLRRVSLRIDEREALEYEYGADESDALRAHGLHRLLATPLEAGTHRLRVELVARHSDARPQTPRIRVALDQTFEKSASALALELSLTDSGVMRDTGVRLREAADPQLRAADFLLHTQAPLAAAHELAELQARGGGAAAPDALALRLNGALQGLGLASAAAAPGDGERAIYTRYNRAVELVAGGQLDAGIALLEELGRIEFEDVESRALRDRANLALGYLLLRHRRGAEAVPVFQRVRSPGPYGNPALLGLGWAYLMPVGADAQPPTAAGDIAWAAADDDGPQLRRHMPFRYSWSVAAGEREQDVRNALAAWNELTGRDPFEPAVQEGMLALAYALGHIGAHEQAERRQMQALEVLGATRTALETAIAQVSSGGMLAAIDARTADGWRRWVADLPYDERTAYFKVLSADGRFLSALDERRRLRQLAALLDLHLRRFDDLGAAAATAAAHATQLRTRVAAATAAQQAQLEDVAASLLQARKLGTERYLAEARFALARGHDPSARALARAPGDGAQR